MSKRLLIASLLALISSAHARAATKTTGQAPPTDTTSASAPWKQITFLTDQQKLAGRKVGGEGGQQVTFICWSVTRPQRIVFGVDVGGFWLSDDAGRSWSMRRGTLTSNKIQAGVAIDPRNSDVIYGWAVASVNPESNDKWKGLYRSLDAGLTWTRVVSPDSSPRSKWGQQRFAFPPDAERDKSLGRSTTVLTCARERILLSADGGATFVPFGKEFPIADPKKFTVANLLLAKAPRLTAIVGSSEGLFQVSDDQTQRIGQGLPPNAAIMGLAQHPQNPGTLWAVVDQRLFKSADSGKAFAEIRAGNLKFKNIVASRVDGNILYSPFGEELIYASNNGGATWFPGKFDQSLCSRFATGWPQGIDTHPTDRAKAILSFGDRLFATSDAGRTWSDSSTKYTGTRSVTRGSFNFHPTDKRVIGIGSLDWGFFYTVNGGDTWRYSWAQGASPARSIYGLLLDPCANWQAANAPQRILAYSGDWHEQQLIRSEDGGAWKIAKQGRQTWTVQKDISRKGQLAAYNSKRPGMVYMGQYKSLDWGTTWTQMAHPADACCFSNSDVLYGIHKFDDGNGLLRSGDCGTTWQETKGRIPNTIADIEVMPDDPNSVCAATTKGVAIWKDNQWTLHGVESGLVPDSFGSINISCVAVDPKDPNRIYAGAWIDFFGDSSGVWASSDRGATWRNISQNLGSMSIWALAVSPHDGALYIGSSYGHWVLPRQKKP